MILTTPFKICLFLSLFIFFAPLQAAGEKLIDAILQSDFVFDRTGSNTPFPPLAFVDYTSQNDISLLNECPPASDCSADVDSFSQALGLPVWVGKKHMFVLGEFIESDNYNFDGVSTRINTAGVLAAWITQYDQDWQLGAFAYGYKGFNEGESIKQPGKLLSGVMGRYRHSKTLHSYWGLVSFREEGEGAIYPYAGFDWIINDRWSMSGVLPWPNIRYSPDSNQFFQLGATQSGSTKRLSADGRLFDSSLSQIELGFTYGRRIQDQFWIEASIGKTGFGRLVFDDDVNLSFQSGIDSTSFIRIAFTFRPSDEF